MGFNNYGVEPEIAGFSEESKPVCEERVAVLKEEADRIKALKELLIFFARGDEAYRFQDITSLTEFLGGVILLKSEIDDAYYTALSRLEYKQKRI